jgi:hypothetical protein
MAAKTLYFRNLQGGAPSGSWELREVFPTGAEDTTTNHSGHGTADFSRSVRPGVTVGTGGAAGEPNTASPPNAADQFGWFSELSYAGQFAAGNWTVQVRHTDNRAQINGHPVLNFYKCTSKDFAGTFTFLFQTTDDVDWWTNNTATQTWTVDPGAISFDNEFLFVNVWCHEVTTNTGRSHSFNVEGSGLTESTVSKIVTSDLSSGAIEGTAPVAFAAVATLAGTGALEGAAPVAFAAAATLAGAGALAGATAAAFSNVATLIGQGLLAGAVAVAFSTAATLAGRGALAGVAGLAFGESANLTAAGGGEIAGAAAFGFANSATLAGAGALGGSAGLTFGAGAVLGGLGRLEGTAPVNFTAAGTLALPAGEITGNASFTFTNAGTLVGRGALDGTAAMQFDVAAAVTSPVAPGYMSVEADLVAALEADSAITALVDDRIYLFEAEQGQALPYIAYEVVASVPVESPGDATKETNETVVDVACYAATLTGAKELAALVRTRLIETLDTAVIENTQDQRDRDTRRNAVVQTYRIWHVEDFP